MLGATIASHVDQLSMLPIFAELGDRDLRDLLRLADVVVTTEAGTTVLEQGQDDLAFAVIVEGEVDVLRNGVRIGRLRRGDTFGEHSIYANTGQPATLVATAPASVLVADLAGFARMVSRYPSVAGWLRPGGREAGYTILG